jgi:polyisoprenoid-binding protein YceI
MNPFALALALLVTTAATGQAQTYEVDTLHSRVTVAVGKTGLLQFAGHEHEVVATSMTGEVILDPARIEHSLVNLSFKAAALQVSGRGEPAKDVPEVQANMTGPKVLDVEQFPAITFRSVSVNGVASAPDAWGLEVRGDLGLHGVTRRIQVPLLLEVHGDSLVATGMAALRQSDFGMTPISVAHVVKVRDEVRVSFCIVARRR